MYTQNRDEMKKENSKAEKNVIKEQNFKTVSSKTEK